MKWSRDTIKTTRDFFLREFGLRMSSSQAEKTLSSVSKFVEGNSLSVKTTLRLMRKERKQWMRVTLSKTKVKELRLSKIALETLQPIERFGKQRYDRKAIMCAMSREQSETVS